LGFTRARARTEGAASLEIPLMAHPAKSRSIARNPRVRRTLFKRSDMRRAIRSAREAGLPIDRVEIDKTGKITVHAAKPQAVTNQGDV
jgi:hypothetical protein